MNKGQRVNADLLRQLHKSLLGEAVMGGWGCPHDDSGNCLRVPGETCDPGMKGCVLFGRFVFSSEDKNVSKRLDDKKEQLKKAD